MCRSLYGHYYGHDCEFWGAAFPTGGLPAGEALDSPQGRYAVSISNPNHWFAAEITIADQTGTLTADPQGHPLPKTIAPQETHTFELARREPKAPFQARLAYRIHSTMPVTAVQLNPKDESGWQSRDGSILLPREYAGKEHVVLTRSATFQPQRSWFAVIALGWGTNVLVTVTAATLGTEGIPPLEPGEWMLRTMDAHDVLYVQGRTPSDDLTGTIVVANRDNIVFAGVTAGHAPSTAQCDHPDGPAAPGRCRWPFENGGEVMACAGPADCTQFETCCAGHLEDTMLPTEFWGKHYVASHTVPRGTGTGGDLYRVVAATDGTEITTWPPQTPGATLDRGEWFEFESAMDFEIHATQPVLVGQFMNGRQHAGPGGSSGPAFWVLLPMKRARSS